MAPSTHGSVFGLSALPGACLVLTGPLRGLLARAHSRQLFRAHRRRGGAPVSFPQFVHSFALVRFLFSRCFRYPRCGVFPRELREIWLFLGSRGVHLCHIAWVPFSTVSSYAPASCGRRGVVFADSSWSQVQGYIWNLGEHECSS